LFAATVLLFVHQVVAQQLELTSPSGKVRLKINNGERLVYNLTMDEKLILGDSPMGFQFRNETDMGRGLLLLSQVVKEINTSWMPVVKSKSDVVKVNWI
jgi:alpha-glucosidase